MTLIEMRSLTKSFRIPTVRRDTVREHVLDLFRRRPVQTLRVLDGINLKIRRGETVGIVGRNGCGKSTLLKIISGIYLPDSGDIVARAPITPILELGVGWHPELDAIDNIYLIGTVMGLSLRELDAALDEILAFAELERFANMKLQHYSSGMAARLAYSVAFRAVREILVLDEIFAVGDAGFKARCEERLQAIRHAGHTVLIVSHDMNVIREFCTRALLLEQGQIVMDGVPAAVCDQYTELVTSVAHSAA
jgi:ABC-type polysaccharide/polyol phosphate transport system ATPase subunit